MAEQGLSEAEVIRRRTTYGKNSLPVEENTNWLQLVLGQFKDLMVIILIAAAVISALLGDTKDVIVILAIVILNAIIGTYQEFQAEKALAALSEFLNSGDVEATGAAAEVLRTANLATAKPGFVDRLIHEAYADQHASLITFEKSAKKLPGVKVLS